MFHQYECPLMEMILSPTLTSTMRMALRIFFMALSLFDGSTEVLEKFLIENTAGCTVYDLKSQTDMKQKLLVMNALLSNSEADVNVALFEEIFLESPTLSLLWATHGKFIQEFLRKQTQIGTMNYHEMYAWTLKKGGMPDDEMSEFKGSLAYTREITAVGSGSYPFIALMNHHCSPNVSRIFLDDKNVVVVQRPIKQGDQLFDNYGFNFTNTSKGNRQMELFNHYKFKCSCEACGNDWPLLPNLKVVDKACLNKAKKACRELRLAGLNQKKARESYKELCEAIEKSQKNFPSLEICNLMDSATAYMELITKPVVQFS